MIDRYPSLTSPCCTESTPSKNPPPPPGSDDGAVSPDDDKLLPLPRRTWKASFEEVEGTGLRLGSRPAAMYKERV